MDLWDLHILIFCFYLHFTPSPSIFLELGLYVKEHKLIICVKLLDFVPLSCPHVWCKALNIFLTNIKLWSLHFSRFFSVFFFHDPITVEASQVLKIQKNSTEFQIPAGAFLYSFNVLLMLVWIFSGYFAFSLKTKKHARKIALCFWIGHNCECYPWIPLGMEMPF